MNVEPPYDGTTADGAEPGLGLDTQLHAEPGMPLTAAGLEVPAAPLPTRRTAAWSIPIALLFGLWLVLAFSSGGYAQSQWLLPGLGLALFALVVSVLIAYPRRPGQLSMCVLALLGLYAVWVTMSALWAASLNSVWDEAGRTLLYLLVLVLAFTFFTDAGARRAARYLLLAAAVAFVGLAVWRLHEVGGTAGARRAIDIVFSGPRFMYPVSYTNGAAALYMILFWPLLWVAADPREWVPVRALSTGVCWALLALTILTQSRGGLWATAATLILLFALSPARLRILVYLLIPAALTVWGFPDLNSYWRVGPEALGGGPAVRVILVGMAIAAGVSVALALLERWVRVSPRMKVAFGTGVLVVVAGLFIYGAVLFDREVGDARGWLSDSWHRFTADESTPPAESDSPRANRETAPTTRFTVISSNGRWDIWRVAWRDFLAFPWQGVGAGNFVYTYDRLRHSGSTTLRQPHSEELRVLSETGIVGGMLVFGALALGLCAMLWPRFSAGWHNLRRGPPAGRWGADPRLYTWETTLVVGVLYWIIHGSVEWLWHLPGVSLPAVLMFALGVASIDARAGVLWPRLTVFAAPSPTARKTDPTADSTTVALSPTDRSFLIFRRADRHSDQRQRRERRQTRRARRDLSLMPPGRVSLWFRYALAATAAVTVLCLGLPYLSLRFQDSALRMIGSNDHGALRAARIAGSMQPVDPRPALAEADIYRLAAANASEEGVLDELALSLDAHMRAIERNPADWALSYRAGIAALRLLEASAGIADGSLTGAAPTTGSGRGEPSLATPETEARARLLRAMAPEELRLLARSHFVEAQKRNPLSVQAKAALEVTDKAAALTAATAGGS